MSDKPRLRFLHFEHRSQPLLPGHLFMRRLLGHAGIAAALLSGSLAIGVLGYRYCAGLSWIDALLNAAMILGGMGQVNALDTNAGKLFAAFYSLYAGVAFLATFAVLFAPLAHRLLHRLHLEEEQTNNDPKI